MYGRFSGVRHVAWRVVNEISFVSVAVYSFTGMFTRPNEMLPLQIARAAGMEVPAFGRRVRAAVYRLRLFYKGTRKAKAREVRTSRPRRDLDRLRRARGLARHAVDAVALPDRFGLVRPPLVPLGAALLDDVVRPRALVARIQLPLEDVDGAHIHADAVRDARLEVGRDMAAVDSELRRVRLPVQIGSHDALREDLVPVVLPRQGVLVRLLEEVGVDWLRFVVDFA